MFSEKMAAERSCMSFFSDEMICSLVTVHIGYQDVVPALTSKRILDVIDRLQLGSAPAPADLRAALTDKFPAVRYWAALAALRAPKTVVTELAPLLSDSTASVRLAAAFATARQGAGDSAWPILAAGLGAKTTADIRLEALNYLTLLPARPDSFKPLYESAAKDSGTGENYVARAADYLLGK
jgi:HEAT repeat protein